MLKEIISHEKYRNMLLLILIFITDTNTDKHYTK